MLFCYYYAEFSVHVCWECLAITVPTITFLCCVARSFIIMLLIPNTHNSRNLKAACLYIYICLNSLFMCVCRVVIGQPSIQQGSNFLYCDTALAKSHSI